MPATLSHDQKSIAWSKAKTGPDNDQMFIDKMNAVHGSNGQITEIGIRNTLEK